MVDCAKKPWSISFCVITYILKHSMVLCRANNGIEFVIPSGAQMVPASIKSIKVILLNGVEVSLFEMSVRISMTSPALSMSSEPKRTLWVCVAVKIGASRLVLCVTSETVTVSAMVKYVMPKNIRKYIQAFLFLRFGPLYVRVIICQFLLYSLKNDTIKIVYTFGLLNYENSFISSPPGRNPYTGYIWRTISNDTLRTYRCAPISSTWRAPHTTADRECCIDKSCTTNSRQWHARRIDTQRVVAPWHTCQQRGLDNLKFLLLAPLFAASKHWSCYARGPIVVAAFFQRRRSVLFAIGPLWLVLISVKHCCNFLAARFLAVNWHFVMEPLLQWN